MILLFEKIKSMVPKISIFLENQHWKLSNPQLKIENITKIHLAQKYDIAVFYYVEIESSNKINFGVGKFDTSIWAADVEVHVNASYQKNWQVGFLGSYTFKNGATLYGSVIVKKNDGKTDTELIVKYDNKDNQPLTLSDAINEGTDNYEHPAVANTFNMVPNWKLDSFTFVVDSANREIMMEGDFHLLNDEIFSY